MIRLLSVLLRPWCLVVAELLVIVFLVGDLEWESIRPKCVHTVIDRLPSPDGAWIASLVEDRCDVGFFASDITVGIDLSPSHDPSRTFDVLGVDTGGHKEERPQFSWSGPKSLDVIAQPEYLKILTQDVEDIHVNVQRLPPPPSPARQPE